jgi:hypothetical protein
MYIRLGWRGIEFASVIIYKHLSSSENTVEKAVGLTELDKRHIGLLCAFLRVMSYSL